MKKIAKLIAVLSLMCCFLLCSCESFELPSFLDGIFPNANQDSTVEEPDAGDEENGSPNDSEDGKEDGSPQEPEDGDDVNGGNWTQEMPLN